MQKKLAIAIALISVLMIRVDGSAKDISDQVYRVMAIGCGPRNAVLVQTGFRTSVTGRIGLVTALHGVVGCKDVVANREGPVVDDLRLMKVDVFNDVAFLSSAKLASDSSIPLSSTVALGSENLKVVGYPQGVTSQLSHPVKFHENPRVTLVTLIPPPMMEMFDDRDSPDLEATVYSLKGSVQPGYSGAPVLNAHQKVVAVVNGGLAQGFADIGWAIPFERISWHDELAYEPKLRKLARLDSEVAFQSAGTIVPGKTNRRIGYIDDTKMAKFGYVVIKLEMAVVPGTDLYARTRSGNEVRLKINDIKDIHLDVASATILKEIQDLTNGDPVYVYEP